MIISVAGASAIGKTYLCRQIKKMFDTKETTISILPQDAYMLDRYTRVDSGYNPANLRLDDMIEDIYALYYDKKIIQVKEYDHSKGRHIDKWKEVYPAKILLLDGSMSICNKIYDSINPLGIFLYADDELIKKIKLEENIKNRYKDIQKAFRNLETDMEGYKQFCEPTIKNADLILKVVGVKNGNRRFEPVQHL